MLSRSSKTSSFTFLSVTSHVHHSNDGGRWYPSFFTSSTVIGSSIGPSGPDLSSSGLSWPTGWVSQKAWSFTSSRDMPAKDLPASSARSEGAGRSWSSSAMMLRVDGTPRSSRTKY